MHHINTSSEPQNRKRKRTHVRLSRVYSKIQQERRRHKLERCRERSSALDDEDWQYSASSKSHSWSNCEWEPPQGVWIGDTEHVLFAHGNADVPFSEPFQKNNVHHSTWHSHQGHSIFVPMREINSFLSSLMTASPSPCPRVFREYMLNRRVASLKHAASTPSDEKYPLVPVSHSSRRRREFSLGMKHLLELFKRMTTSDHEPTEHSAAGAPTPRRHRPSSSKFRFSGPNVQVSFAE